MLKCREDEAKSWPRSSSADGLRGGWQPTLCTCITFKKEKLTPSHPLFLFGANFSLAHCIQELRGSHMGYSSGWPNLQGQTYRSWLERNWANWLGLQLALWHITKWSESRSVMSDSARILEWVAIPFSRGFSQLRDRTQVSHIVGRFFTSWATRKAQEYWSG